MEMLLDENKNLVCGFCELFIINPDEIKDLTQQPKLTWSLVYSVCPLCGQDAIDKKDSVWCKKIDNCFLSFRQTNFRYINSNFVFRRKSS